MKFHLYVCDDTEREDPSLENQEYTNGTSLGQGGIRTTSAMLDILPDGCISILNHDAVVDQEDTQDQLSKKVEIDNILSWSITDDEGKFLTFHVKRLISKTRSKSRRKSSLASTPSTKLVTQIEVIKLQTRDKDESMEIIAAIVATYMRLRTEHRSGGSLLSPSHRLTPSNYQSSRLADKPLSPTHQAIANVIDAVSTINEELQRKLDFPGDIVNNSSRHEAGGESGSSNNKRHNAIPRRDRFPSPILSQPTYSSYENPILDYNDGHYIDIDPSRKKGNASFLEMELNQTKEEAEELRIQLNFLESVTLSSGKQDDNETNKRLQTLQKELDKEKSKNASLEFELHSRSNTPNKEDAQSFRTESQTNEDQTAKDPTVVEGLKAMKDQFDAMKSSDTNGWMQGSLSSPSTSEDENRKLFNAMMDLMRQQEGKEKKKVENKTKTHDISIDEEDHKISEYNMETRSRYGSSADVLLQLSSVRKEMNEIGSDDRMHTNPSFPSTLSGIEEMSNGASSMTVQREDYDAGLLRDDDFNTEEESLQNGDQLMHEGTPNVQGTDQLLSVIDGILGKV